MAAPCTKSKLLTTNSLLATTHFLVPSLPIQSDTLPKTITKKDLENARRNGMSDVFTFLNQENLKSISREDAVSVAGELLDKKEEIFGYAKQAAQVSLTKYRFLINYQLWRA
jgi:hypothetical protein